MFQKLDNQQLQSLNYDGLVAYKAEAGDYKAKLEAAKAKGGKAWSDVMQEKLDDIVMHLVDVEEYIEAKAEVTAEEPAKKTVPPGMENCVVLSIVKGRRFNPMTGAEESQPYTQAFTFSEWQLFKKHYAGLGYSILEVINDPYNDAAGLVVKTK